MTDFKWWLKNYDESVEINHKQNLPYIPTTLIKS